ncbi:MAG: hypothetical protein U0984_16455 [Prosthecobacter sp.]|nr:hypothetical protein [Prosthecobacter sp.]
MSDPRNAAHDKRVSQEKKHHGAEPKKADPSAAGDSAVPAETLSPQAVAIHEGSLAVLTQMKDMEFHSRANLERLGGLMLTVEDELKQKAFANSLGDIFSLQDALQTKLTAFIEAYKAECESV